MQNHDRHILIVEPDKLLARTYRAALEHAGFTVTVTHGAEAAVHAADAQRPDAVLLELRLAAHDGVEFLHEFRSYPEWQNIPVIVQTAMPPQQYEAIKTALRDQLGVTAYIYKTGASLQRLTRTVHEVLAP